MKRNKGMQLSAVLAVMLIVSMVFVPAVSAKQTELASDVNVGEVTILSSHNKIEVKENTKTSSIVQVDDVLISLKSNAQHTEAVMTIENLVTKEKETIDYKVSKKSGEFTTEVYYQGELANTYVTDYDPLEPGITGDVLKNNNEKTEYADQVTIQANYYWWDDVYFAKGYGIKYPHPDYATYMAEPWDEFYITGDQLTHYHIADWESAIIAPLAPVAAGAAIGAYLGSIYGAVAGAVLGLILGGTSSYVLMDEEGCIWFWYANSYSWIVIPIPPFLQYLTDYFRIAEYTLWDELGIGNP